MHAASTSAAAHCLWLAHDGSGSHFLPSSSERWFGWSISSRSRANACCFISAVACCSWLALVWSFMSLLVAFAPGSTWFFAANQLACSVLSMPCITLWVADWNIHAHHHAIFASVSTLQWYAAYACVIYGNSSIFSDSSAWVKRLQCAM